MTSGIQIRGRNSVCFPAAQREIIFLREKVEKLENENRDLQEELSMKTSQQHLMVQQQQKLSKKFNDFSGKFRETVTRFSEEREKNVRLEKEVKQLSEKNQSLENGMKILQNEVKCLNLHLKNVLEIETETRQTQTDDVVDAERCISEEPKHRLEKWQTDILQNFLQLNFSKYLNEKKIRLSETATAEEVSINEDKHPVNEPCEQMTKTNDGDNFVTTQQ